MKLPHNEVDAAALKEMPEVGEFTDDEIHRELRQAQNTIDEETTYVEALCAEQRRRAGPNTATGFAYLTPEEDIDLATVGPTAQSVMVNALYMHAKIAVLVNATLEEITAAFNDWTAKSGGKVVAVRVSEELK